MDKSLKRHVKNLLEQRDEERLVDLCEKDRHFWHALRFRLYDTDDRIRWAAIETVGKLMKLWWQKGRKEKVRNYIRTLFWSITDESGGIGWSASQTIAEIIFNIPELADPYGSMMIAHTFDEPPLVKGGLWGLGRIGKLGAGVVIFLQDKVLAVFQIDDAETLGLAAWAMGEVEFRPALPFLEKLIERKEPVHIYIEGNFYEKTLGQWAREAIDKING
ncbi:MAG: hypothetical protein A2Y97_00545 [Nitrospirae bacterium RBG_13_39_12]|nr:MAG: hypothetical protein A2Y97_00545 [Nitrospirae bacterium RBG_13_39_12]